MARPGPHPVRGDAALLAVVHRRRCWSRAGPCSRDVADLWFTSHINENLEEIEGRGSCSAATTSTSYERPGWSARAACFAHNVHPTCGELMLLAGHGRASPTARPPTPRSGAGCSRSARTWRSGSGSRSAPTSAPAPASRCSRRGCRRTSSQQLLGREGHRLLGRAPAAPGHLRRCRRARAWRTRSATSRWASSSTPCGCAPPPARPSTSALRHARRRRRRAGQGVRAGRARDVAATWVPASAGDLGGLNALPPTRTLRIGGEQVEHRTSRSARARRSLGPRRPSYGAREGWPASRSSQTSTAAGRSPPIGRGLDSERAYASTQSTRRRPCCGRGEPLPQRATVASGVAATILGAPRARRGGPAPAARGPGRPWSKR